MQHLNSESLARLVDEAPSHGEAQHLAECETCRHELDEMRTQTAALSELPTLRPAPEQWRFLDARLRAEGLIRSPRATHAWWSHAPLRMAAALALFLLGGFAGAALTGGAGESPVAARGEATAARAVPAIATVDEAVVALREQEAAYLAAFERYAELAGEGFGSDPATRLAALEGIVLTTRAALEEAPADPVINGYHLTALGQRNAVLRQIAQRIEDPWY